MGLEVITVSIFLKVLQLGKTSCGVLRDSVFRLVPRSSELLRHPPDATKEMEIGATMLSPRVGGGIRNLH